MFSNKPIHFLLALMPSVTNSEQMFPVLWANEGGCHLATFLSIALGQGSLKVRSKYLYHWKYCFVF